jgi:hypothetical protein
MKRNIIISLVIIAAAVIVAFVLLRRGGAPVPATEPAPSQNEQAAVPVSPAQVIGRKPLIPSGLQVYQVSQAAEVWPKILQATIDPPDVHVGDTQKLSVIVEDSVQITSVEAQIQTDNETITLPLTLVGPVSKGELLPQKYAVDNDNHLVILDGAKDTASNISNIAFAADLQKLKYEGQWVVRDTHNTYYHTTFTAKDEAGKLSSVTLAWSDLCGLPMSGDATISSACTISGATDGVDNGNLTVASSVVLSAASGVSGVLAFNSGFHITINSGGSISICTGSPGCSIKKTNLWVIDQDRDGYASGTVQYAQDSSSGLPTGAVRRSIASSTASVQKTTMASTTSVASLGFLPFAYAPPRGFFSYFVPTVQAVNCNLIRCDIDGCIGCGLPYSSDSAGTVAWTNPQNATTSNNIYATAALSSNDVSYWLRLQNWGFNLPRGVTLTGILVEVEQSASVANVVTSSVRLLMSPQSVTAAKGGSTSTWGTTDAYASYGGSTDLWGASSTSVSADQINSNFFGIDISVRNTGGSSVTAKVDHARITVYYVVPPIYGTGDCDDTEAAAYPGQSMYFSSSTARGSYDYNCNGSEQKKYTVTGDGSACGGTTVSACVKGAGLDSVPACGGSGIQHVCRWDAGASTCYDQGSTIYQSCH